MKKSHRFIFISILLCLTCLSALAASKSKGAANDAKSAAAKAKSEARAKAIKGRILAGEGLKLFAKKDYKGAIPKFAASAESDPRDPTVQYYLGISAIRSGDYRLAEQALSRVVVMSPPTSKYATNALKCFDNCRKEMNRVRPYSCIFEGSKFWRWSTQSRPVKVYISPGLQLPKGYSGADLNAEKISKLAVWLRDSNFIKGLKPYRHYREQYHGYVEKGLQEWSFASAEGIVRFTTVDDPTTANVLLFWCPTLPADAPGHTVVSEKKGEPVIIELAVEFIDKLPLNLWPTLVQTIAAHEFGHAWGLQHSDFKRDIMFPTDKIKFTERGTDQTGPNIVTPNDAATLRALYDLNAPILK